MITIADTTDLKAAHLPPDENDMSRRYLRLLEMWIPIGVEYFNDWPERPHCGHFFGGCLWYGGETIGPAEAFALASVSPEYDEEATGVSASDLREMAIKGIRYLCFTHDTGPEDCVRPSTGLGRPETCGTKWGERGRGFFPESQCGRCIGSMTRICLLLRNHIDEETWMMMARILEDYAERFGEMPPRSGVYVDTQMEENGWTSLGLTSCALFLCGHARARDWEAMTRRWMYSTCAVPQDAKDHGPVGENTARALAHKTFTGLPDYWAENHGMVHPNYTSSGVHSLMSVGSQLKLWGKDLPPELFWNRRRIYDNLKALTDGGGYAQAVQGMDWPYLPTVGAETPHAIAAVFFDDPDAAALQRLGLRNAELRMSGNNGRLYDRDLAMKAHGQQDPLIMREPKGIGPVAHLCLLHRLFGSGPDPTPRDEVEERLAGVRTFPHAGFVHHRHGRGQTSLAWRNSIMVLPLTREGIFTVAPCSDSWLGIPIVKDRPDSHRLKKATVTEYDHGFAAALILDRCQESLRQQVLFASLPDGRVLSFERLVALVDLTLESLDQGFLRITNEHFPLLAPNCRGTRTLYHPDGSIDYKGWHGDAESDDIIDSLGHPRWINVDDRLGIRYSGTGQTIYHNRHHFKPYRAVADDLTLSRQQEEKSLNAGDEAGHLAALLIPEQAHVDTTSASFHIPVGSGNSAALTTAGYLAAANFEPKCRKCVFSLPRPEEVPVYSGATVEANGDALCFTLALNGECSCLLESVQTLRFEGDVRIDAIPAGATYVTNIGNKDVQVEVTAGKKTGETEQIGPGKTKSISG